MRDEPDVVRVLHVAATGDAAAGTAARLERADDRLAVAAVAGARAGRDRIAAGRVDCVVSDHGPDLDGVALCRAVRESRPRLPFVLFTADGSEAAAAGAVAAGASDYLRREPDADGTDPHARLAARILDLTADDATGGTDDRGWVRGERERALQELQRRTQSLMGTTTRAGTARVAVDAASEVLDVPLAGVHLVPAPDGAADVGADPAAGAVEGTDVLEPVAVVDRVREVLGEPPAYRRDADPAADPASAVVWDAVERGEPLLIEDVTAHEYDRLAAVTPARSGIVHPLGDRGALVVSATEPRAFDATDEALVEILATALAAALDRVARERRLQAEHDRLTALFEAEPDPIVHVRLEGDEPVLLDGNPAFEGTFGVDVDAAAGRPIRDLAVPPDDRPAATDDWVREAGTAREVRRRTVDGVGDFLFRSVPIGDPAGTDEYFGIYVDIGEQKAVERRLERQNERLEEFADIVSHDLRNPLNVAAGRLTLARELAADADADADADDPALVEHLDAAASAHDRMEGLVDDLLTLARQRDAAVELEPVELSEVVEQCWRTVDTGAAELAVDVDATVAADRSRLRQLLENLLRNAVEHGGPDVSVTVGSLDGDADGRGFYVADDGPGVPPERREAAFEQGHSTSEGGTGFGLAIVSEVAQAHGWTVDLTDADAGGARFEVRGVERTDADGDDTSGT